MAIVLTEADTAQLRRMIKRPKSLRQFYFARVILNLARGKDAKKIARSLGLSIRGIVRMIAEFEAEGLASIRKKEPRSTISRRTVRKRPRIRSEKERGALPRAKSSIKLRFDIFLYLIFIMALR